MDTGDAVSSSQFTEVWVTLEVDAGFPILEEKFLPLANHAEVVVIENHNLDGELMNRGGR